MKPAFVLSAAVFSFALLGASGARAATSQKVEQSVWGVSGLPSYVNMYIYVPDKLATKPPILVASHHCQGTAASTYSETKSTFVSLADKNGFIIIFPEATGHNCWDVGSAKSLKHDGGGDTQAVAQMVRYTLAKYNGDAGRVVAFGGSSGAMMTQALMGVYPDLFVAGVAVSGVPCGCWASSYTGDVATNGQWSGPCAGGQVTKTAQAWGDQVRSMFTGYSGHRPRLQLWHGTADTTISYKNLAEAVKEWTNLLDLSATPTTSNTELGGPHEVWKNACGFAVLETFSVTGAGHGVSWDLNTAASFLGLDKLTGPDPEAAACPTTGGAGAGGAGTGTGGAGTGGAGTGGAGGVLVAGGRGGVVSSGGVAGGRGGSAGAGGSPGVSGANSATGGLPGNAGGPVQGGATNGGASTGGMPAVALGGSTPGVSDDSGAGCGCVLARHSDRRGARAYWLLLALGILALRRSASTRAGAVPTTGR